MASMTMTASSLLGGSAAVATSKQLPTTVRRGVVVVSASRESEKAVANSGKEKGANNTRRDLMFGVAAAVWAAAKVAMADEPKPGTPEAKKKYAPVCVTMPTAHICRR